MHFNLAKFKIKRSSLKCLRQQDGYEIIMQALAFTTNRNNQSLKAILQSAALHPENTDFITVASSGKIHIHLS